MHAAADSVALAATRASLADVIALLKPRVMGLAVFTALVGLAVAPGELHPVIGLAVVLCVAGGAAAAAALNMWWDADIDRRMERTQHRPVAAGRIAPAVARDLGIGLGVFSVVLLALFSTPLAGALLALAILHYVVVYTMWLKRSTVHNVVLGGAAGALPPMIGWAAAAGSIGVEAVLMFALIFLWTPPHSWALAWLRVAEYQRVGVPMLPVTSSPAATCRQILIYTVVMVPVGVALSLTSVGGPLSFVAAAGCGLAMLFRATALARNPGDRRRAGQLFGSSIWYLFLVFATLLIETGARVWLPTYGW